MKTSKIILSLLATTMVATLLSAENNATVPAPEAPAPKAGKKELPLEEMKAKMNASIDKRIANLKIIQECANKATTKDEFKACKPKKKSAPANGPLPEPMS